MRSDHPYLRRSALPGPGEMGSNPTYDAWEHLRERLFWAHGHARACDIISGNDKATQADIAAWRGLGGHGGDA